MEYPSTGKTLLGRLKDGNQLLLRRMYAQYKQNIHFPEIDVYKSLYKTDIEIMFIYLRKGFHELEIREALNEYNDFIKRLQK
ncbi:hypothetical protein [Sebaldella sp. S0638]|uniref:hypothetical protein n=1 Tax=Sebaldella sp. S0638 TaxID=2957809 RepID=UPI00209D1025|nr:hypothetical protein [Sebaldella sp. S0638]MCP1225118.1 hypothetical protein [Sebaldella sp. S0638]